MYTSVPAGRQNHSKCCFCDSATISLSETASSTSREHMYASILALQVASILANIASLTVQAVHGQKLPHARVD